MAGPCANCCQSREPCLGDCQTAPAPELEGIYEIEIVIELHVTVRVLARGVSEAAEMVQRRGVRELAREAWVRGKRRLLTGSVKVPFPPGHKPRPR